MSTGQEGLQRLPLPLADALWEWAARPGWRLGLGCGGLLGQMPSPTPAATA